MNLEDAAHLAGAQFSKLSVAGVVDHAQLLDERVD
jgi:hypothetical protein